MRRLILAMGLFLIVCEFVTGGSLCLAQRYPDRPIQYIVPNVAGSIMDINSRLFTEDLGKILGTQVVPVNKPGAATILGTDALAKSKKDGYTIGYASNSIVYARILNPETFHFDPDKDIEPLGQHVLLPLAAAVKGDAPWNTFEELIDYAKKNPGKVRVDTIGIGSPAHFNLEIIQSLTGAQFTHVPFKGGQQVVTALLGGHVEVISHAFSQVLPHVDAGKMRILLMTKKMAEFPNLPTLPETGYKQDLLSAWFALYGPAGIPEEVKKVLVPAIEKASKDHELKAKVEKMGFIVDYKSPAELKKLGMEDYEKARAVAVKVGLQK